MALKTRNTFPPGGFPFHQVKADGKIHKFSGLDYGFNDQVTRIQEYRMGNGLMPTDRDAIANELDTFQCDRLGNDPKWCGDSKKNSPWGASRFSPSHLLQGAKRALKNVRNVVAGSPVLYDWLGAGGIPVSQALAQERANICLACPKNQEGHLVARLTALVAKAIHDQRRLKLQMGLRVDGEERLQTCECCSCHLPLKVWVPFDVIEGRTLESEWDEFREVPACWMNHERKYAPAPVAPSDTETRMEPERSAEPEAVAAGTVLPAPDHDASRIADPGQPTTPEVNESPQQTEAADRPDGAVQ